MNAIYTFFVWSYIKECYLHIFVGSYVKEWYLHIFVGSYVKESSTSFYFIW